MFWAGPPHPVPIYAPDREEVVMPCIAVAAADELKVSPCLVDTFVFRSSARWRGPKYAVHFFHVYSVEVFTSHSGRSLGKEMAARIQ